MSAGLYTDPEVCQAVLMDYYRHPRCAGVCGGATHTAEAANPACGDVVRLGFRTGEGRIAEARASGAGCAVSQATASLLAEALEGKTAPQARSLLDGLERLLTGGPGDFELLDRLGVLRLIAGNPARVQCARTARRAATQALEPWISDGSGG